MIEIYSVNGLYPQGPTGLETIAVVSWPIMNLSDWQLFISSELMCIVGSHNNHAIKWHTAFRHKIHNQKLECAHEIWYGLSVPLVRGSREIGIFHV